MGERKGASRTDRELVELIQNDDAQATHDLFEKKQKLIETWADKFQKTFGNCGRIVNREDFVQAGNLGLLCAAKEFDLDKGEEFSIIAERMIRQMMAMELLNDGLGRVLSINEVIEMQKVLDVDEKYQNEMDQEKRMLSVSSDLKLSVERVKKLLALYAQYFKTESLDASDFERGEECLAENNPQDHEKHFEPVMDNERKKAIAKVLMDLKQRERDVIIKLYGLEDGRPLSLEEVGCDYGVTRERIRQIEAKALRKLRNPERSKYIKDFLPDY